MGRDWRQWANGEKPEYTVLEAASRDIMRKAAGTGAGHGLGVSVLLRGAKPITTHRQSDTFLLTVSFLHTTATIRSTATAAGTTVGMTG